MTFSIDDTVKTPKGKGTVCYVEDGYIEVDVHGVEMGFEAPFNGVSHWTEEDEAPKTRMRSDSDALAASQPTPEFDDILDMVERAVPEYALAALLRFRTIQAALPAFGGSAPAWDSLNSFQKLNHIAVAAGLGSAENLINALADSLNEDKTTTN